MTPVIRLDSIPITDKTFLRPKGISVIALYSQARGYLSMLIPTAR